MNIDYQLFELINRFAGKNHFFDQLVILFSKYGPILFCLVFVWLWFSKTGNQYENRKLVLFAITIAMITIGVDKLIEFTYFRPRPFVSHSVTLLIEKTNTDPSFPSNHAAGSFALAITMFWKRKKIGTALLFFAFLMALSRIFVGVHYPLDVTAGALIALVVSIIIIWQRRLFDQPYNWIITGVSNLKAKLNR